ncbi:hypothetical protein [Bradyrhizobium sp. CCGUVB23]|uniref:hypothetical protein n=1 Tax=Bradyrhizobium sp. CCGUVB23 TaxID=2949630 RepID=UPI0020B3F1F7|nr:hypothetical protein [Bradyrhizobium sp. CCGUVB23]MCP3462143.1 hypothetical protein [Bradyrhizobium sp. CCGUVB23]
MRGLGLTLLACCLWSTSAFAKPPLGYSVDSSGPHQELKDHTLYEIRFVCERGPGLAKDSGNLADAIGDFFLHHNDSANQYIIVGNDSAVVDATDPGKIKLPEKAISIVPVFSIKDQSVVDNFDACQKSIYVQGTQKIYLIPTVAWSSHFTEGAGLSALYQASKLISPLWSLFNPAAIPAAIASKISNAQATEDPIKSILSQMNADQNYGTTIRLRTGRYIIKTKLSTVTLNVSQIPSIVGATSDDLRRDFRAALDAAPQKIPSTNFEGVCSQIATTLQGAGFSQDQDIPYALTHLASGALSSKGDLIRCLGIYAVRATRLGNILWSWIPEAKRVTEEEASIVTDPNLPGPALQPDFSRVEGVLDDFVRDLSRTAKNLDSNGKPLPQYVSELKTTMAPTVIINDRTEAAQFDSMQPLDAQRLGEALIAQHYFRFGCYAQITEKFGSNTDGAAAMFIAFKVGKDTPSPVSLDTALGVRVLFGKGGLVSQLTFTDKRPAIMAALDANGWNCNLVVQKPTS